MSASESAFTTSDSDYLLHAYITQRLRVLDVKGAVQVEVVRERAGNWFEIRVVVTSSGETVNACRMLNCTDLLDKVTPAYAMDLLSVEMDALCRDIAREQQKQKADRAERQRQFFDTPAYRPYGYTTTNNKITIEQTAREMLDMGRIYEEREGFFGLNRQENDEIVARVKAYPTFENQVMPPAKSNPDAYTREYYGPVYEPDNYERFQLLDLGPKTKEADDQSDDVERYRQLDLDWP